MTRHVALLTFVAGFWTTAGWAQDHHHHRDPGERLGRVHFPVSCSGEAPARFERAMLLLHSFWWEEADRAFRDVLEADPECGMGYWGLALTSWNNPFAGGPRGEALKAGGAAAAEASRLGAATQRERDYIAAVEALYFDHDNRANATRLVAYADVMDRVRRNNPDDAEAAILHALALVATAPRTDTTFAQQRRALELLDPLYADRPDHPGLAHYIIHAGDTPRLAELGLDAARRYAAVAPSVPHAQHMPSHIFIRLGLWDENVQSNIASYEAGARYAAEHFGDALGEHEFHAMDYIVYGLLQLGRDAEAEEWTRLALGVERIVPPGTLVAEYARAAMPARLALERNRWNEAAGLPLLTTHPVAHMVTHFARGVGAARSDMVAEAREAQAALAALESDLRDRNEPYWARVAGIKRAAVHSWITLATGDTAMALVQAREAADLEDVTDKHQVTPGEILPARELYGDMLWSAGKPAEAILAYRATLAREPGRARSLFGVARSGQ